MNKKSTLIEREENMKKSIWKKCLSMFFAACMVISLAACGSGNAGTDSKDTTKSTSGDSGTEGSADTNAAAAGDKILKVGIDSTLDSLDPWGVAKPSKSFICGTLYQPLGIAATIGSEDIQGVLMKAWEQVDDYTYKVTLYDNIKDSKGNSLTASDAIFSFNKWSEVNTSAIVSMEKIDEYTFTMTLNTAVPGMFQTLAQDVYMTTEAGYTACGDGLAATSCGTSPYVLKEFVSGSKVVLVRNENYWQTDASLNHPSYTANADVIEFDILTEITQMGIALEQGDIQLGLWVNNSLLNGLSSHANLEFYAAPCTESRGIMFNMTESSPFYNNLALREAVCYAIDNETVVEACTYGYGEISKGLIGSPDSTIGYNSEWSNYPYSYDPEKAKEKLAEAGYSEGELTLRLLCNNNAVIKSLWECVQANLSAVGINATLDIYDGSTYGSYRDGTSGMYELAYCGAQMGGDVTKCWDTLFNSANRDSGATWFGLKDDHLQSLYDTIIQPNGFTQANIDVFYNYIETNCLYYQVIDMPTYLVYNTDFIKSVSNDNRNFMAFGAFEFAD